MKATITWLRISYLTGAVADGTCAVLMLMPSRMAESEFRYPMGLAASLMFGWTLLLLWANLKPLERKGVLLLTIFPMITGLFVSAIWAYFTGLLSFQQFITAALVELAIALLMAFSYQKARSAESPRIGGKAQVA